ncbi:hypothetical protein NLU13_9074 [Sarocladium strictum]|uniref:Uncharacterized protein n=1 Tax=Sarocladium strictum TaxID=5046 RepID=A0AA39L3J7_SARSR|nr:hypothetical protein NLU13_9074 [Sarocladium strictum]
MKYLLTIVALRSLLTRAEECDPDLFKSFPPSAQPTNLGSQTATILGVQPAKVICSGVTTITTLIWTYMDVEPTACVALPDNRPVLPDDVVDLGSGSKDGPPGLEEQARSARGTNTPGSEPSGPGPNVGGSSAMPRPAPTDGPVSYASQPTDILPDYVDSSTQSLPPGASSLPVTSQFPPAPPPDTRFVPASSSSGNPAVPVDPSSSIPGTILPLVTSSGSPPIPIDPSDSLPDTILPLVTSSGSPPIPIDPSNSLPDTILPLVTSSGSPPPPIEPSSSVPETSLPPTPSSSSTPLPPDTDTSAVPLPTSSIDPPNPFTRSRTGTIDPPSSSEAPPATTSTSDVVPPVPSSDTSTSSTSTSISSAAPGPSCSDIPNGEFTDGETAPWYISDQVTADSSAVVETDGQEDHPHAFALIPSQGDRAQVYLNNYLPRCGDPPPEVTLQVSLDYQFTGESTGCSIAVTINRPPQFLLTITDDGTAPGVWQSAQGEPVTVQLTYDPLFTVRLMCDGDTANEQAILVTDIKAYS